MIKLKINVNLERNTTYIRDYVDKPQTYTTNKCYGENAEAKDGNKDTMIINEKIKDNLP